MWAYCKMKPGGLVPRKLFQSAHQKIVKDFKNLSAASLASSLLNVARAVSGQFRFWDDQTGATDLYNLKMLREVFPLRTGNCWTKPRHMSSESWVWAGFSWSHSCGASIQPVPMLDHLNCFQHFYKPQQSNVVNLLRSNSPFWCVATLMCDLGRPLPGKHRLMSWIGSVSSQCPGYARFFGLIALCDIAINTSSNTLLSTLSPSSVAGNKRCARLCAALLEIQTYFPDMDPEGLQRYMSYVQPTFRLAQMRSAASEGARRSLGDCLSQAGLTHQQLVHIDGYIVDLLVPTDDGQVEKPVAIQFHSAPRTLHLRSGEPLGDTMMKQHLRMILVNPFSSNS